MSSKKSNSPAALRDFLLIGQVADPYSRGLAADGERSQVVALGAAELKPDGWDGHASPPLASLSDISLYELHVRDFRWGPDIS